ncbi:MAG: RNA-binding transcriptional accessory protein [Deltaproteobacteria bacterium]|nr:RNA-binding transcriptional accessory protein [Deltaproteobacteria bacterium]
MTHRDLSAEIASSLSLSPQGVAAVVALLDEGATVPFIARYRKERTGSLDEVQIRDIAERRQALVDLAARRKTIEAAIAEQGALTPALVARLEACRSRAELEDLYAPFKKSRKTRADKAREAGYGPLAELILRQVERLERRPAAEALAGAQDIVAEELANRPELRRLLREALARHGELVTKKKRTAPDGPSAFEAFYGATERVDRVPPHRYLAVCRGEAEGFLSVSVAVDLGRAVDNVLRRIRYEPRSPLGPALRDAVEDSLKRLLIPSAETAVRADLKTHADKASIAVFGQNLEALLMAPPLGAGKVLGVDPGIRTGCKCAVVSATGEVLAEATVHLVGREDPRSLQILKELLANHRPDAVAVGNGTGGREAEAAIRRVVADQCPDVVVVSVNEAGASVYSASDIARAELPGMDVTMRGAVSIARRLQDPLAELVKIDPKAIGVGQYQHDVDQGALRQRLSDVVESCVNRVGVNLATASAPLLAQVAGIGPKLSQTIVAERARRGAFPSRSALMKVPGLGARTYEQCAGFLRVPGAPNPLDASAVHPECYPVVERMANDLGVPLARLVGDATLAHSIPLERYADAELGLPTLRDIIAELARPGRDPRSAFEAPKFRDDVHSIADLCDGMELEGVVTNVTDFGAFVDIGVHQDGLVHVSKLAAGFVRDPHAVVRAGDRIPVRVLSVDVPRKRISLERLAPTN